jgi:hypothetical protein
MNGEEVYERLDDYLDLYFRKFYICLDDDDFCAEVNVNFLKGGEL